MTSGNLVITRTEFWQLACAMAGGMMANPAFAAEVTNSYGRGQIMGQSISDLMNGLTCVGIQVVDDPVQEVSR